MADREEGTGSIPAPADNARPLDYKEQFQVRPLFSLREYECKRRSQLLALIETPF